MTRQPHLLVVALLITGCSLITGQQFSYTFPAQGGRAALPVVLTDKTGYVVRVAEAQAGFDPLIDEGMATVEESPDAFVIHWIGGACDERIAITAEGSPSVTYVVTTTTRPGDCEAIGIPRALLIQQARRVDMQLLAVRFEP